MRRRRLSPFDGFTLLELLLVLAIIGLLISLSIPAIQASREAARRTQCTDNLKQFGVAFLNYESRNRAFPPCATMLLKGPLVSDPDAQMHSVISELLPFLEEGAIDAQYHRDVMFFAPENTVAIAQPLSIAICPSAPGRDPDVANTFVPSLLASPGVRKQFLAIFDALDKKCSGTYRGGITDYAVPVKATRRVATPLGYDVKDSFAELGSMFPLPSEKQALQKMVSAMLSPGAVQFAERTRAAKITDGLSHTFMMTEVAGRPEHWQMGQHTRLLEPLNSAWADPFSAFDIEGVEVAGRKQVLQATNDSEIYSFHQDGVNFLFADGHVVFLSADTDPHLILALMTPNQGDDHQSH